MFKQNEEARESFSDVINRLLKHRLKLKEVAGSKTITFKEWETLKEAFKDQEKMDDAKREYLLRLIGK